MIFKKIKYTIANIQQTKPLVKLKTYKTSMTHKTTTYKNNKRRVAPPFSFLFINPNSCHSYNIMMQIYNKPNPLSS